MPIRLYAWRSEAKRIVHRGRHKRPRLAEYSQMEETLAPLALETMSAWILHHTQP